MVTLWSKNRFRSTSAMSDKVYLVLLVGNGIARCSLGIPFSIIKKKNILSAMLLYLDKLNFMPQKNTFRKTGKALLRHSIQGINLFVFPSNFSTFPFCFIINLYMQTFLPIYLLVLLT